MIIKIILGLINAVPAIERLYDSINKAYINSKIEKYKDERTTKMIKSRALMRAIKNATTNEDRKNLSVMLNDINNSSLRNNSGE